MINFIIDNTGTVLVLLLLAAAVVLSCFMIYRDKRAGKSSCGGNCGGCPYSSQCGNERRKDN